jgi:stearoyl-CoA desaturase (delta-9 desaturase)
MSNVSPSPSHPQVLERRIALVTVITPLLAIFVAIFLLWDRGVDGLDLGLLAFMYLLTGLGIVLGFHRLFTHRSFKCVLPVKVLLGILGCMAAEGPIYFWAACHRHHHQCSDSEGDPHSPHTHGEGWWAALRGLWHAHAGWMFSHAPENYRRLVPDLLRDRDVAWIDRYYFLWIAAGLLFPALVGWAVTQSGWGFLQGLLWGGFVRIFLVHHTTWSINSICHLFGASPFSTPDESRNNAVCAALTFGEGWHNNHHAFPSSSRHGLFWWQVDLAYVTLRLLRTCGLAWDLVVPSPEQIRTALNRSAAKRSEISDEEKSGPVDVSLSSRQV